ncbi:MAG TPA: HD domain-containing protein, partial [Ktedonobacteraceae bacterium]|nr:HD domain-containing protein [Ktedonobacteraceae bacterium]
LHDLGRTIKDPTRTHAERSAILATMLLAPYELPPATQHAIMHAILAHSYSRGIAPATLEARVLYDADRLDSLGASGLLRWAMSATHRHWPETKTYHPQDPFATHRVPDDKHYLLDRLFTRLLTLEENMTTASGKIMAQHRTAFLRLYLQEFQLELQEAGLNAGLKGQVSPV